MLLNGEVINNLAVTEVKTLRMSEKKELFNLLPSFRFFECVRLFVCLFSNQPH